VLLSVALALVVVLLCICELCGPDGAVALVCPCGIHRAGRNPTASNSHPVIPAAFSLSMAEAILTVNGDCETPSRALTCQSSRAQGMTLREAVWSLHHTPGSRAQQWSITASGGPSGFSFVRAEFDVVPSPNDLRLSIHVPFASEHHGFPAVPTTVEHTRPTDDEGPAPQARPSNKQSNQRRND
jgi:hypothetical protein